MRQCSIGVIGNDSSFKYENIYLHGYEVVPELVSGLKEYFRFYDHERLHEALGYRTPAEVYQERTVSKPNPLERKEGDQAQQGKEKSRQGSGRGQPIKEKKV
jgi:hypothetical protein